MKTFGVFCFSILLFWVGMVLSGFTVDLFWDWFIIPVFQVKGLWFSEAVGLSMVMTMIKARVPRKEDEVDGINWDYIIKSFTLQGIVLSAGYIVSLFM
jgi:hypothetical protein